MKHHQSRSIPVQLLALSWVAALLVSCHSSPLPAAQPKVTRVSQESAPEPARSAAIGIQGPAGAESPSVRGNTRQPEEKVYWPTDAWQVIAPEEQGMDAALLQQMLDAITKSLGLVIANDVPTHSVFNDLPYGRILPVQSNYGHSGGHGLDDYQSKRFPGRGK